MPPFAGGVSVNGAGNGSTPTIMGVANMGSMDTLLGDMMMPIYAYVQANQTTEYLLAVSSSMMGSTLILETGEPVLFIGGFSGSDPIYTADSFAALVETGRLRFVLAGGLQPEIETWVTESYALVEEVSVAMPDIAEMMALFNQAAPAGSAPNGRGFQPPTGALPNGQGFQPPAVGFPGGRGMGTSLYDCAPA